MGIEEEEYSGSLVLKEEEEERKRPSRVGPVQLGAARTWGV